LYPARASVQACFHAPAAPSRKVVLPQPGTSARADLRPRIARIRTPRLARASTPGPGRSLLGRCPGPVGDLTGSFFARMGVGGLGLERDGEVGVHLDGPGDGRVSRFEVIEGPRRRAYTLSSIRLSFYKIITADSGSQRNPLWPEGNEPPLVIPSTQTRNGRSSRCEPGWVHEPRNGHERPRCPEGSVSS
jgi:hypothetical protein